MAGSASVYIKWYYRAMIPIVILSSAWAESVPFSLDDIASVLDLDVKGAAPAAHGQRCPRCGRHPGESEIRLFDPDSATSTPERVTGREIVQCLCKATYWYHAVHALDVHDPVGEARVRAAAVVKQPATGTMEIKAGDALKIHVHDDITPTDSIVVNPGPATASGGTCGPTVVITGAAAVTFPASGISGSGVVIPPPSA
jgi:hypothetical protein